FRYAAAIAEAFAAGLEPALHETGHAGGGHLSERILEAAPVGPAVGVVGEVPAFAGRVADTVQHGARRDLRAEPGRRRQAAHRAHRCAADHPAHGPSPEAVPHFLAD